MGCKVLKTTSGQPVLCMECLRGTSFPPSKEVITFSCGSASWLLILSTLTVDPLHANRQSTPLQDQQRWLPFHVKVEVDCWPSPHWPLTLSTLTVDPLHIDHQSAPKDQQRWFPFHTKVKVDCWSSLCQSLTPLPPRINRGNHLFMWKWKLHVDPLHIDHWSPQDQKCWLPVWCWLLILPGSTVDRPPTFLIFNIRIMCKHTHGPAHGSLYSNASGLLFCCNYVTWKKHGMESHN